jgi:hypothetical protein
MLRTEKLSEAGLDELETLLARARQQQQGK